MKSLAERACRRTGRIVHKSPLPEGVASETGLGVS